MNKFHIRHLTVSVMLLLSTSFAQSQSLPMPQDHWVYNGLQIVGKFGAIALGPDGYIYAATNGGAISVFSTSGQFVRQFGSGMSISGIALDGQTNIYVMDYTGTELIKKFNAAGTLLLAFGQPGDGTSQINSYAIWPYNEPDIGDQYSYSQVAVGRDGRIYVADPGSSRVQIFDSNGNYQESWYGINGPGYGIVIAASPNGDFCGIRGTGNVDQYFTLNTMSSDGSPLGSIGYDANDRQWSIGISPDGLAAVLDGSDSYHSDFLIDGSETIGNGYWFYGLADLSTQSSLNFTAWKAAAFDTNSTLYVTATIGNTTNVIVGLSRIYGVDMALNHTSLPIGLITLAKQRTNSTLVDIDYVVQDAGSAAVTTAIIAFGGNNSETLGNLLPLSPLAEGTQTNLGPGIVPGVGHRVTWDPSSATTNFANFQFEILANDGRSLLPVRFITVPASPGHASFTMSSQPVADSDLLSLWFWLIGTNNPSITLTNGTVVGVGGSYNGQVLASGTSTTSQGRAFLYQVMNVAAPTAGQIAVAQGGNFRFSSVSANNIVQLQ